MTTIGHSLRSDGGPIASFGGDDAARAVARSSRIRSRLLLAVALLLGLWVLGLTVAAQARADDPSVSTESAVITSAPPPADGGEASSAPSAAAISEPPVSEPADSSAASTPPLTAPLPLPSSTGDGASGIEPSEPVSGTADPVITSPPAESTPSGEDGPSQTTTAPSCPAEHPVQTTLSTADPTVATPVPADPTVATRVLAAPPTTADLEACAGGSETGGAAAPVPATATPTTPAPAPAPTGPPTLETPPAAPLTPLTPAAPPAVLPVLVPEPAPARPTVVQAPPAVIAIAAAEPCPSDPSALGALVLTERADGLLDATTSVNGGGGGGAWTARHVGRPTGAGRLDAAPARLSPSDPDHGGAPASAPQREPEPAAPPAPPPTPSSSCSSAGGGSSASSGQSKRAVRTGLPYCVLPPGTDADFASPAVLVTAEMPDEVRSTADEPDYAPD